MRELILLRHAHAEPAAPGQDDFDRPLSLQGQAEAEAAGRWLRDHGSGQSGDFRGMPAGGIAVLSMPADADLEPGIARLAAFWWP